MSHNSTEIKSLINSLKIKFPIKDLGNAHYFLGIEVVRHSFGFILSQYKYIVSLLLKTNMAYNKPSTTQYLIYFITNHIV